MENQRAHKYYCPRCDRYLYGESPTHLAIAVNYHATAYHPQDCSTWTSSGIVLSKQYEAAAGPLPQYLEPHGTTSKKVPVLTDEDKAMLKRACVAW
jgi:hypothetical protein